MERTILPPGWAASFCGMALATFTDTTVRNEAIVQRRRDGTTVAAIAAEFGLSTGRVSTILKDGLRQEERREVEQRTRSVGQAERHAAVRHELLTDLPPCGCPACRDPQCDVPPGYCHHCRSEQASLAEQTHREARTVLGYPLMYCSRRCRGAASKGDLRATAQGLLADAGGCGSPGCIDSDCTVSPGHCHRPGCQRPARVATFTDARIRTVRGHPLCHCSKRCERLENEAALAKLRADNRRREQDFRAALRAEGLEPVPTAAAAAATELHYAAATIRHGQKLAIETRTFGGVTRSGINVRMILDAAPDGRARQRLAGPLAAALSGSRGTVYAPHSIEAQQPGTDARIIALHEHEDRSVRSIAAELGVSKSHVQRVIAASRTQAAP